MSGKRVKIYQISNNVTEDTFIGSTTSALYKRLYRHKYDADKGVKSKLCDLIRALGKDKFKIELVDEGVFLDTDAVNAREMSWIRERRCTLNECYSETKSEGTSEQNREKPQETSNDHHGLNEYMLTIMELQQQVKALETQLKSLQCSSLVTKTEQMISSPTKALSDATPVSIHLSDGNVEVDAPPDDLPRYDLTDYRFIALEGKVDEDYLEIIRMSFAKVMKIGRHMKENPRDDENKQEMRYWKERLAKWIANVRMDGLDPPSSRLVDAIEKEAGIGKNLRKKMTRLARDYRDYKRLHDDE